MADQNEIRVSGTMTAIAVLDETINGIAYEAKVVDQNIDTVGGEINWNNGDGYESASACKWTNVQIDVSTLTPLSDNSFNLGNTAPTGNIPAKVRSVAIKYDKKTGSPGRVILTLSGGTDNLAICALNEGEGCAIPINGLTGDGFDVADIGIHQISNNSTNYANITVALLGHDGI